MSRDQAIAAATALYDSGELKRVLARRVAIPTESQNPERAAELDRYIAEEMIPAFDAMGFTCRVLRHERAKGPFLLAERIEDPSLVTVFGYGHGDAIRGLDALWDEGLSPWTLTQRGDRWYGRGVVDNKGQHTINIWRSPRC
jgi:acetylornithine deacetylase/succinyl-diaminopimelate desuccinylase-like protein